MIKRGLLVIMKGYQYLISPILGPCCRFQPTCSIYAEMALEQHGIVKGGYLVIKRLLKCHPFHAGGYDPVPHSLRIKDGL